jgi:murein DD-endopeptidase MepM/ murein hydrolase activator NlpD
VGNNTTTGNGVDLWRNPSYCTIVNAQTTTSINRTFDSNSNSTTQWDYYHAIYIVHANAYSSWYLHVADILPTLKSQVVQNGYVWVNKGDQIATVGNFAYGYPGGVAYHLHFGVRNYNGVRADPYGNDSFSLGMHSNFNLLWQQRPQ